MTVRAANEPIEWAILWQTFVGAIGGAGGGLSGDGCGGD
jgi:hypothetical protein